MLIVPFIQPCVSGGGAGLGGEAGQSDPVQRPGHQPPAGGDAGRADEGHPGPRLRCPPHQQAGRAPEAADHHPDNLLHHHHGAGFSRLCRRGAAARQSAAGRPEAEQHGGGGASPGVG